MFSGPVSVGTELLTNIDIRLQFYLVVYYIFILDPSYQDLI